MELLPYEEFSSLRLKQFLPPDADIDDDDWCSPPIWRCKGHDVCPQTAIFCFADDDPRTTVSGIGVFKLGDGGVSFEAGDAILRALRSPVSTRATREELIAHFGEPEYCWRDDPTLPGANLVRSDTDFLRFVIGSTWVYRAGFTVRLDGSGLTTFWICRNDFWIEEKNFWEADEGDGE